MNPENQTDHIALLALTMSGVLIKRLNELGQLDEATARHLHRLVDGVRRHARSRDLTDLNVLFDNLDDALSEKMGTEAV
jgi:hypothetical protein